MDSVIHRSCQISSRRRPAFSLAEMLIVIAILGIMAAIVIGAMGGTNRDTMVKVRDQRNAQEVVSLSTAATNAGLQVVESGDMRATIKNLMKGKEAKGGIFAGRTFRLSKLSEEEITGAINYLDWNNDQIIYTYKNP
jgi:prepilin-type N-terminal cleavage/methylation domain-containing protein